MAGSSQASQPVKLSELGSMVFVYVRRSDTPRYFEERLKKYQKEGKIPDLDKEAEYTIYQWQSGFFKHKSVVLGCEGKFFTIEIQVANFGFILRTTAEKISEEKLKECGKVVTTGRNLINKGIKVFKNMGEYNIATNNCQDFVNKYLEEIGMDDKIETTDMTWLAVGGGVAAAVGAAAIMTYSYGKSKQKK